MAVLLFCLPPERPCESCFPTAVVTVFAVESEVENVWLCAGISVVSRVTVVDPVCSPRKKVESSGWTGTVYAKVFVGWVLTRPFSAELTRSEA